MKQKLAILGVSAVVASVFWWRSPPAPTTPSARGKPTLKPTPKTKLKPTPLPKGAFGYCEAGCGIEFSPDGAFLLAGQELWDWKKVRKIGPLRMFSSFASNGTYLGYTKVPDPGGSDYVLLRQILWRDIRSHKIRARVHLSKGRGDQLRLSKDRRTLLSFSPNGGRVFRFPDGKLLRRFSWPKLPRIISLSPDGTQFLATFGLFNAQTDSDDVSFIDARTGRLVKHLVPAPSGILGFFLSPNNRFAAITNYEGADASIRNVQTGRELWTLDTRVIVFSPDSRRVAVIEPDGRVTLRNVQTGKVRRVLLPNPKTNWSKLAFSPDGRFLAVSDHEGFLWKVRVGK